jgi:hypothetical protein
MQLIFDAKRLHLLFVFRVYTKNGFGIQFRIFNYRNVIGISSKVKGDNHIILGDFEKKLTTSNINKLIDAMVRNNVAVLFILKSSKGGKYHFESPQIFSWLDALRISKELGAEKNYLSISSVRGEFIVRISKKGKKNEPLIYRIIRNPNAFNPIYSEKHVKQLELFHKYNHEIINGKKTEGGFICEKYRTTNI